MRWLFWIGLLAGSASAAPVYTLTDLEALDKQGAWEELARHLEDIPPAKRDPKWQALLERTAVGLLGLRAADPASAVVTADFFTVRFPTVKKSKDFMTKRAAVGLAALETCKTAACAEPFIDYVDADPKNADLAVKAGIIVAATDRPALAVAFFSRGLRTKSKDCSHAALDRAVRLALELPPDHARVPEAQKIASQLCWDALAESLVSQFAHAGKYYRRNTCGFLLEKKALSNVSTNICKKEKP